MILFLFMISHFVENLLYLSPRIFRSCTKCLASSLGASNPSNAGVQTASRNARLWDGSCLKQMMFLHSEVIERQAADLAGGEGAKQGQGIS